MRPLPLLLSVAAGAFVGVFAAKKIAQWTPASGPTGAGATGGKRFCTCCTRDNNGDLWCYTCGCPIGQGGQRGALQ